MSKMILNPLNRFGWVQIILVRFKLDFFRTNFINLEIYKMILVGSTDQNELYPPETIDTQPKWFGWYKIILDP